MDSLVNVYKKDIQMTYNIKSIKDEFKKKGIFYTPPELAKLLKSYVDIKYNNVYDPTCGDGGLLCVFDHEVKKYGQEINSEQLEVAKERLINFTGVCGDTLSQPAFLDKKFDLIMANPPFSIKWSPLCDKRFESAPTIPTKGKADYAFILHILYYLSNTGKAIVLNFPGILYRGNREAKIRQWIIEQNWIERVVNIPGDTFVDTKIATALIVFNKNKKTTDIIFEDKELKKERTVSIKEIAENDFNLSVSTYVYEEMQKEQIDSKALQQKARNKFLKHLKAEIDFEIQVCKLENNDVLPFLNSIIQLTNEYIKREG